MTWDISYLEQIDIQPAWTIKCTGCGQRITRENDCTSQHELLDYLTTEGWRNISDDPRCPSCVCQYQTDNCP